MKAFTAGDRVKNSAAWLKSIKAHPTEELWRMAGTVVSTKAVGGKTLVKVLWDGDEEAASSFPQYLRLLGTPEAL